MSIPPAGASKLIASADANPVAVKVIPPTSLRRLIEPTPVP